MSDSKQNELLTGLASNITKYLRESYGEPRPNDNMPARIAVALLQLSARYFIETGAPKEAVKHFVDQTFGIQDTVDPIAAEEARSRLWMPVLKKS